LIAGTKHHGTFEERIKNIFDELKNIPDAILFIDDIHNIMNFNGGNLDLAAIIKDAITNDNLRVIGTVADEDYRKYLDKDRNFLRRFNNIHISETSDEETIQILNGLKSSLEQFYDYKITEDAIKAAVKLSKKYMGNKYFPDKAIDLIDSTLSTAKLNNKFKDYTITKNDVLFEVSNFTKISESVLDESEKNKLSNLHERLEKKIFGQSEAISKIVDCILISKTGLRAENKTVANLLFRGMSGVGKTEISKELAKNLGVDLLRFDLSAYQEKFSLSVLIGSPPGYLGYSDGRAGDGLLVTAIEKSPNGVILLDEVEKAHPEVLNIMLQMMDYGILTSAGGKSVSCRNNIIIMTSNIGSEFEMKQRIGFGNIDNSDKCEELISSFFKPEFRSRLDAIINFNKLSEKQLQSVVVKVFNETIELLNKKGIEATLTPSIQKYITSKSYFSNFGARNVETLIDSEIKPKIAEILLTLDDNIRAKLNIDYVNGEVKVDYKII
jgi:ATP-dependent Clp protease ATP-binding subunit ClpA